MFFHFVKYVLQSIREFLDSAENGAVIISLGTNVNWKSIGVDKLKAVTQALSKLNQRVIWKLEIELSFQKPNNVMVVKWLQQNEILGTSHNLLEDTKNMQLDVFIIIIFLISHYFCIYIDLNIYFFNSTFDNDYYIITLI